MDRSKFCEQFLKRVTQGTFLSNYFKIWPAVSEKKIFLRIFSCLYSARSSHSSEPSLWTHKNFANNFWKGSPKEHSCKIISKSDQRFQMRRFLKNCLKKNLVTIATRVFDGIKFCEHSLKRTSHGTFLPSLVQTGPAVWEENLFKEIVDDGQRTTDTGPP